MKPVSTLINNELRKAAQPYRLVRGRGYYYVSGVAVSSALYVCWLDRTQRDLNLARDHVNETLRAEGSAYQLPALKGGGA